VSGRDHHAVEINGLRRELPLFEVAPGTKIAVFNLLGDTEVVETAAAALAERLADRRPQTLYLDEKDLPLVRGRRVALVDDVISTGSTVEGMRAVVDEAGGEVVVEAAVFTEGDPPGHEVVALGHLPLFREE
jgi:predicted phosphoribosyltransferase